MGNTSYLVTLVNCRPIAIVIGNMSFVCFVRINFMQLTHIPHVIFVEKSICRVTWLMLNERVAEIESKFRDFLFIFRITFSVTFKGVKFNNSEFPS